MVRNMANKKTSHVRIINIRLNKYILPELKHTPINEITSETILKLYRRIEARGTIETAARVKVVIGQIFEYVIATDRAENDPTTPHAVVRCALKFSTLVFCRPGEIRYTE